ncbi:MAG: LLM class flavin-dependent oxidoreductase, partial [Thermomicrobiales bacterium]
TRGFGVAGALDRSILKELAPRVQEFGYDAFWVNDTPAGDGLEALAAVASAADGLRLAVGVIALDRKPPAEIADRVRELKLPPDRLTIGVGAGGSDHGLSLVREGVAELRTLLEPEVSVVVGALGPRMCELSGQVADGVLLNWLTPAWARQSCAAVLAAARAASRNQPSIIAYVRAALGNEANRRLREEAARYRDVPGYARHFARMGASAYETAVHADDAASLQEQLMPFNPLVDETVVRAITAEETTDAYLELAAACAPGDRS